MSSRIPLRQRRFRSGRPRQDWQIGAPRRLEADKCNSLRACNGHRAHADYAASISSVIIIIFIIMSASIAVTKLVRLVARCRAQVQVRAPSQLIGVG